MHHLEINDAGLIRGWISGDPNGAPGYLYVIAGQTICPVAATIERPDVLAAGHTLYAGFCLRISAPAGCEAVQVRIENQLYDVTAVTQEDTALLHFDTATTSLVEGWVETDVPLSSLCFSDGDRLAYPELISRPDVAAMRGGADHNTFGFRLEGSGLSLPKVCIMDNTHIHIFASAFASERAAA